MPTIKEFKAYRPNTGYAEKIAELPYDVMNEAEARKIAENNPYSFLYIDRAEINFPLGTNPHDKKVYDKANEKLNELIDNKALIQDETPCLYVYRLIRDNKAQTGLAACVSVDEYNNNIIKKHELTRKDKEEDRINHVLACSAHTGPIFMTYRHNDTIDDIIKRVTENPPVYDFTKNNDTRHIMWVIDDNETILRLKNEFALIDNLYIADGHHRNAAAAKAAQIKKEQNPLHNANEEYNFYLAVMFAENQLTIMDYNRIVKDLAGLSAEEFTNKLKEDFTIDEVNNKDEAKPQMPHTFGMYLNHKWYRLSAKAFDETDVIEKLDVSLLQRKVLTPILKIDDVTKDKRIDFIGGIRGLKELENKVDSGEFAVAFALYPTNINELLEVADAGKIMPPKSTWFEPKLLSGLLVHGF